MTEQGELPWSAGDLPAKPESRKQVSKETGANGHRIPTGDDELRELIDDNFLQYASYVIRDRAIPDLADGLKPVQRRILHSLHQNDDGKFIKVANIVGHTMQYHPHGDASIADALVNLTNKGFLIEGQGNFGNILTGDPAAASRYIECRLTELARNEIFHPDLTRFVPSYDGRNQEPVQLPSKLPLLLMLGAEGIAVGLSTRILPHNFKELLEAQVAILQKKPFEILPDFQQGGLMDASEYDQGRGKVRVRAVIEPKGTNELVIRQIPFGTTTDSVMASIEDAAKRKKVNIKSIDDFTAADVELQIKLGPEQDQAKTIEKLYAFTQCEVPLSSRLMVIRDNRPVEMAVNEVLKFNTKRLIQVLKRELELEHRRLFEELHRKTLVQIFVEHRIYKRIEECKTYDEVQKEVFNGVNAYRDVLRRDITQKDIEMLLGIPIKRISRFDIEKNRKEIGGIVNDLAEVEKNLGDLKNYTIRYLRSLIRKYGPGYQRRTTLVTFKEVKVRELTATDYAMAYDQDKGYFGHAVKGEPLYHCSPKDRVLVVWKDGRYKVMNPPDKLFVDHDMIYCSILERNKVITMVFADGGITYMKRFKFGGAILNKEYHCALRKSDVLLFTDSKPGHLYVKYKKEKRQRIHQQVFDTSKLPVKNVKARGTQMTVKTIATISTTKLKWWNKKNPSGALMDFV